MEAKSCVMCHCLYEYAEREFSRTLAFISREIEMELIISAMTTAAVLSCDAALSFPA
jgi:hypothetical protein